MDKVKETGGARIGMANATWPFATLTVTKDKLELNATIMGNLVFRPTDIISIEPYSGFFSRGLKINHCVPGYKANVIFWTFCNPANILKRIEQTGFLINIDPISEDIENKISRTQANGGFPIKTSAAIVIAVIWNLLFFIDFQNFFTGDKNGFPLGIGVILAFGFILLTCILLLTTEPIKRLILKEDRTIDSFKKFIFFVMFICVIILLTIILSQ